MRLDGARSRSAGGRVQRAIAGLWFGAAGFAASALMYLAPSIDRGLPALLLYLALPAISGAAAGWLVGHRVLAAPTGRRAAWLGVVVVALAYVVYAPLYALGSAAFGGGHDRPLPLALSVLTIGLTMTGPLTLPLGALAGFVLFRWSRRSLLQPHALDC